MTTIPTNIADISHLFFSEEQTKKLEELEHHGGLVGIVLPAYQAAVHTLTQEHWSSGSSDTIGHWWRRIGEHLGHGERINDPAFFKELENNQTTLSLQSARDIAVKTKEYITSILDDVGAGNESPGRGSILDAIYNPPLDELGLIIELGDSE